MKQVLYLTLFVLYNLMIGQVDQILNASCELMNNVTGSSHQNTMSSLYTRTLSFETLSFTYIHDNPKVSQNESNPMYLADITDCQYDHLSIEYEHSENVQAIYSENLTIPIYVNGSPNLDETLNRLLNEYMIKSNIQKIYGTIVLNEADEIIYLSSYQNEMYNFLKNRDSLSLSQKLLKRTAHLEITDGMYSDIKLLLESATWTTGECFGHKVKSYLDFHVSNSKYEER